MISLKDYEMYISLFILINHIQFFKVGSSVFTFIIELNTYFENFE